VKIILQAKLSSADQSTPFCGKLIIIETVSSHDQRSMIKQPNLNLQSSYPCLLFIYQKLSAIVKNELNAKKKLTTSELYIRRSLMSDIGGLTISPMYSIICKSKSKLRKISRNTCK